MGLFTAPNSAGVMNSLPPAQRGAGAGMLATFTSSRERALDRRLLLADDRRPLVGPAVDPSQRPGRPRRPAGGRDAHRRTCRPSRRSSPRSSATTRSRACSGRTCCARCPPADARTLTGRSFFPHLISQSVPHGARLRVRLRDRRLPDRRGRLAPARRQVPPPGGGRDAGGRTRRARAGRAAGIVSTRVDSPPQLPDRRGRAARRSHDQDDPLLRGARPARPLRRPEQGCAPALHRSPTSPASRSSSGFATCSGSRWRSSTALADTGQARAALRDQWAGTTSDEERAAIVDEAIPLVQRQLDLVRTRQRKLDEFAAELSEKLHSLRNEQRRLGRRQPAG